MNPHNTSLFCRALRLYVKLVGASVRSRMQYPFDFIASLLIQAVMVLYDFVLIAVILWRFTSIASWDIYEVGALYAVSRLGFGLYRLFCNELDRFEAYIVRGEFDSMLVRPWPSLLTLLSRNLDLGRMSWIVQGIGVMAVCLPALLRRGSLDMWGALMLLACSVLSLALFAAVGLATASAAFWIVRIEELQVFTVHAPGTASLYPLDIYPGWLRNLLLTVLPVGVGNYIPCVYLLGKGGSWLNLVVPPVWAAICLLAAYRLWRLAETRYHSTGS